MSRLLNIFVIEPSSIICQGITGILSGGGLNHRTTIAGTLHQFMEMSLKINPDAVFVNSSLVVNQLREFQVTRKKFPGTFWIGIVHSLTDSQILASFDEVIYINDPPGKVVASVQKLLLTNNTRKQVENLSERETDVLRLLVAGNSNKEIADKLNISPHTVITHRKNISQKTGIKSVSGLTIYAVLKEIVSVNDYME